MKIPILTLDTPNKNGRVYPKELVEKVIEKYTKEFIEEKRAIIVSKLQESTTFNLIDTIGVVKEMKIEDDKVVVDAEFLPQLPEALLIEEGIKSGKLHLRTSGIGSFEKDKNGNQVIQSDYEFIGCFVTDNPA